MFKDLILDDLVLYILAQNEKTDITQTKNTTKLIQVRLEVLKEKDEEKVTKTRISLQASIICNSRKF